MKDVFKKMFPGPLRAWSRAIVFADDTREGIAGSDIQRGEGLDDLLSRFSRVYGAFPDRNPLISLWSQTYFDTVLPALLGLSLATEWEAGTALEQVSLIVDENGVPLALRLDAPIPVADTGVSGSLHRAWSLVDNHLEPFVMAVSACTGLSSRRLWSNAAWAGDWALSCLAVRTYRPGRASAVRETLASERTRPDGRDNPLYHPVVHLGHGGLHRRLCCLRYRLPGFDTCAGICPGDTNGECDDIHMTG